MKILELIRKTPPVTMLILLLFTLFLSLMAEDGTTFQQWADIILVAVNIIALIGISGKTRRTSTLVTLYVVAVLLGLTFIVFAIVAPFTVGAIVLAALYGAVTISAITVGLVYDFRSLTSGKASDA